jgi:putative oxidoreductase
MQRLYSTFANGWPGYGLLVLRAACAVYVLCVDLPLLTSAATTDMIVLILVICAALALVLGWWTPLAAAILAILQFWQAHAYPGQFLPEVLTAVIAFSLTLLGPGAWSVDARLYGRRRISFDDK